MRQVAIIGAGIGREHLAAYLQLPHLFNVSIMCDLDTARAAEAIGAATDIEISGDVEAVFANPDIDIIDICLPPHLHVPMALQALAAGKDVICEKPLACSLADIDVLQEALKTSKGSLLPVFQYRYGKGVDQLKALIDAGLAGRPFIASAETHWDRDDAYYAVPWRGTFDGEAGGALLGHAIHAHDIICHILGPVAEVSAYTDTRVNDIEVEDCAAINMMMENGALVTSSVTLGAADNMSRFRFCFSGLTAESGTAPYSPAKDSWVFTPRGATKQSDIDAVLDKIDTLHSGFTGFLEAASQTLSDNTHPVISFADGQRSIELVTACYQSHQLRKSVKLPLSKEDSFYQGWRS